MDRHRRCRRDCVEIVDNTRKGLSVNTDFQPLYRVYYGLIVVFLIL